MDQDHVRFEFFEYRFHAGQDAAGQLCQRLSRLHKIKVEIRRYGKELDNLIQHLAMLGRDADLQLNFGTRRQRGDDGRHFNGFRTGAKCNQHTFFGVLGRRQCNKPLASRNVAGTINERNVLTLC